MKHIHKIKLFLKNCKKQNYYMLIQYILRTNNSNKNKKQTKKIKKKQKKQKK